jgi:hypothetical protein
VAAITYWVDPVSGSNANDGLSFANALETSDGASDKMIAAGNGNDFTVNLVNTGTHVQTTGVSQIDGQSGSTFHIRGTDSSGNPAFATVEPDATINLTTEPLFYIRENAGILCEYIKWDTTARAAQAGSMALIYNRDTGTGTTEFRYCQVINEDVGSLPAGTWYLYYRGFGTGQQVKIHHCYFQSTKQITLITGLGTILFDIYDNVFISENDAQAPIIASASGNSSQVINIYNNTVYALGTNATNSAIGNGVVANTSSSGDAGAWGVYNNVVWLDIDAAVVALSGTEAFIAGQNTSSAALSGGTQGYNMFYLGDNASALGDFLRYSDKPWDPGVDDLYGGDVYRTNYSATDAFVAPSSTYDWTPDGSALAITLAKDLRLNSDIAAGLAGALPGALPIAFVDPSISAVTYDPTVVVQGDSMSVVFTYTEDAGTGSTGTEVTITVPSKLTDNGGITASGSYSSGVWTLGTMAAGETTILQLSLSVNQEVSAADTMVVTGEITSHGSGTSLGGTTSDDSASVTFTGKSSTIVDPGSPARVPLIDVLPTVEPRFFLNSNIRLRTRRNRQEESYLRSDEEDVQFSEFRGATINLATNTSLTLNMGGVERASYLLYDADNPVQLSINGGTFMPSASQMAITKGAITSLKLKNASTSDEAEIFIVVVD